MTATAHYTDAVEAVAVALKAVPRDPNAASADDLAKLAPIHALLAAESAEITARSVALAAQLEDPDAESLALLDLMALGFQQGELRGRAGRLDIASTRLDTYTAAAASALGFDLDRLAADH